MRPDDKLHIWPDFLHCMTFSHDVVVTTAWAESNEQKRKKKRAVVRLGASFPFQSHGRFNETDHYRFMWHLIKMFAIGRTLNISSFVSMEATFFFFTVCYLHIHVWKSKSFAKRTSWAVIIVCMKTRMDQIFASGKKMSYQMKKDEVCRHSSQWLWKPSLVEIRFGIKSKMHAVFLVNKDANEKRRPKHQNRNE